MQTGMLGSSKDAVHSHKRAAALLPPTLPSAAATANAPIVIDDDDDDDDVVEVAVPPRSPGLKTEKAAAMPAAAAAPVAVAPAPAAAVAAAPVVEGPVTMQTESGEILYEAERIVGKRRIPVASGASTSSTRTVSDPSVDPHSWLFRVKWRGFEEKDNTWEPYANIEACVDLLQAFYQEDAAATLLKKQQRKEKKQAAATAAALDSQTSSSSGAIASPPGSTPSRTPSAARLSLGSKLSSFPAGALECGVCGQSSGEGPEAFVFCTSCFAPAHRSRCSEGNGSSQAGGWSCSACAVARSMSAEEPLPTAPAAAASATTASQSQAGDDIVMATEPVSRTDLLRTLLLAVQAHITRDNWQSVPLEAHGNAAVDWQSLASAFHSLSLIHI